MSEHQDEERTFLTGNELVCYCHGGKNQKWDICECLLDEKNLAQAQKLNILKKKIFLDDFETIKSNKQKWLKEYKDEQNIYLEGEALTCHCGKGQHRKWENCECLLDNYDTIIAKKLDIEDLRKHFAEWGSVERQQERCYNPHSGTIEHNLCVENDGNGYYEMCYRCGRLLDTDEATVKQIWEIDDDEDDG